MSQDDQHQLSALRTSTILLSVVIGVAAAGYFVGISDGVPRPDSQPIAPAMAASSAANSPVIDEGVAADQEVDLIAATPYNQMRRSELGPTSRWKVSWEPIVPAKFDPQAEIKPSESDKLQSTLRRGQRRAFNGAPPIIPHRIEGTSDSACYACHGMGMKIGDQMAGRMSHPYLANCTQCHAPPPPQPFAKIDASVESTFVGLPAPRSGSRAYPGAPPTIPHSTWMRQSCLACHGLSTSWSGLESTHPWRVACTQCHAPSASLEQGPTAAPIEFVPGPRIRKE